MAKIMLVNPLFLSRSPEERALKSPYFPLGLLYLAAYLRERNHEVALFDGTFEADESAFERALSAQKPDLVGITALLPIRESVLGLAQVAHDAGVPVIVGGPDPTREPKAYLSNTQVDIVVHHEGEETLLALLDHLDQGSLNSETLNGELGLA